MIYYIKNMNTKIFLLFILIHLSKTQIKLDSNWRLDINNGNQIEFKPGVFSKITIQLTNLLNNYYFTNNDENIYKVTFFSENEDFIFSEQEITLNPKEELGHSIYIGLKCQQYIQWFLPKFYINVSFSKDQKIYYPLINNKILSYKLNSNKVSINLDALLKKMPGKSINLFKLQNEIFNIDEIIIEPENSKSVNEKFDFENIFIKSYLNREELSEENSANNGILFDYPFKIKEELTNEELFTFKLDIKNETLLKCFYLENPNYDVEINKGDLSNIDEKEKTDITYNTYVEENIYDLTNILKIKTKISVFPSILTCEFMKNSSISENSLENSENVKIFKTFINANKSLDIIMKNLDSNSEYIANCELSNTDYDEKNRKKINITIGNYENADIVKQLIPSKDENRVPQCATFNFEKNVNNIGKIIFLSTYYCYYIMKKDELSFLKALPTIKCQAIQNDSKSITFCVAPLPLYNLGAFFSHQDKEAFDKNFNQFIEDEKKYFLFAKMNIKNIDRIKDIEISRSSINTYFESNTDSNPMNITFNVLSTHNQSVECYYNPDLSEKCKFSFLKNSIILKPNQKTKINTIISSPIENKMYSLNFICYNLLQGFGYRYKTTGFMTMYTYLYKNNDELAQIDDEKTSETTINCNIKINLLNPRCLKDNYVSVIDNLKTYIPSYFKEIENQVQLFSKLAEKVKNQFMLDLQTDIQKNFVQTQTTNLTFLIENAIKFIQYLTYTDCSVYSSGSSNKEEDTIKSVNFVKCRENKKAYLENIINILKNNLPIFDCNSLIQTISHLDEDIEINLKYILILINELSNNPESYKKGLSQILFKTTICLKENFDIYWEQVEKKLIETKKYLNTSITAIKKDATYIIMKTLVNLAKIIHYDELDGYINSEKTETGIILNDTYIQIQKEIIDFSKKLNEFGDNFYSLSGSMFSQIEVNKELNISFDSEIKIISIPEKDIIIKLYSNYMLRNNNAKTLQILVFDSPLVSVKTSGEKKKTSDSINSFISIILFNEKGEEIPIKSIKKEYRPEILYLKNKYDSLKKCFYFNEEKNDLETVGIVFDEDFKYNGKSYIKCSTSHLTTFTAGTYNFNSNIPWWVVLLIIIIILLILLGMVTIFVIIKKKSKSRASYDEISSTFKQNEGLLN